MILKNAGKEELVKRLYTYAEAGADIPKIAVMPKDRQDVLTLLAATAEVSESGMSDHYDVYGGKRYSKPVCAEKYLVRL